MNSTLNKNSRDMLLDVIKNPYAWPGGYERLAITKDGSILCSQCCRNEVQRIMSDIRDGDTGWLIEGLCYEVLPADCCDEELHSYCGHCNRVFGELY